MYSICTVFARFGSVQILYIYCTYTVHMTEKVALRAGFQLVATSFLSPRFSVCQDVPQGAVADFFRGAAQ